MACAYVLLPERTTPTTVTTVRGGQGGVSSGIALLLTMYALKNFESSLDFDVSLVIWKDLSSITVWGSLIDAPPPAMSLSRYLQGMESLVWTLTSDAYHIIRLHAASSSENGHSAKQPLRRLNRPVLCMRNASRDVTKRTLI